MGDWTLETMVYSMGTAALVLGSLGSALGCTDEYTCPRYGVKTFNVEDGCNVTVTALRNTRRCVALFRPRATCTNLMVTCDKFYLPNEDAPVYNCPGMSHTASGTGNLKLWWRMSAYPGMYPDRKARCTVYCTSGSYV